MLFFSISSVSSQSLNDFDDNATESKVIKSSSLSTKTTTLSAANKVKSNATTKVKTNATKKTSNNATKTSTNKNKEDKTTVNKKTLAKTSTNFMNYVEKNGKFPKVKISNKNYSNTEYLYLMTKAVENDSNPKVDIKKNLVKKYSNTNHKSVKGSLNKTEYVKIAGKTRKFIDKNKRAPNWVSSSKGNIPYNQLILSYSKCLDFYNKNNRLPNSIRLDDLDLDKISSKINAKKSKSSNSTVNSTKKTANVSVKPNTTASKKTTTNATKKTTTKANTTASKKTTTNASKSKASTTKETKNTPSNTNSNNGDDGSNTSLVEMTLNNIHNILNNILDRLDPSKYKVDVTKSDEANVKLNTSKVNVDVNGKSTVNVKVSAKNTTKKTTNAKTTTNTIKETATKVKTTTNAIKKTVTKNTAKTSVNSTKKNATKTNGTKTSQKNATKTNGTKTSKTVSKANYKTTKLNDTSIPQDLRKYLSSSRNCQISNKEIKELSQKLTSTLKSDYDKGKKLFKWVRDNVQYKKYRNTRRGAVKTLKTKKGNCVDQSHLLIALSRASGIPARYVKGDKCRFTTGYVSGHIWTEILVGNKWVVADPTSSRNTFGKIRNWNTNNYVLCGKYSSISF